MTQAFYHERSPFDPRPPKVESVVDKGSMDNSLLRVHRFSPVSIAAQIIRTHSFTITDAI